MPYSRRLSRPVWNPSVNRGFGMRTLYYKYYKTYKQRAEESRYERGYAVFIRDEGRCLRIRGHQVDMRLRVLLHSGVDRLT